MLLKTGDLILLKFPFTDLSTNKQRPGLVLGQTQYSKSQNLVTVAMITSNLEQNKIDGDIPVEDWEKAGLLFPSLLRLSKIATVESELVTKRLGKLSNQDEKKVSVMFRKQFKYWI